MSQKKICLIMLLLAGGLLGGKAMANSRWDQGEVTMNGAVLDSACAIDMSSRDQTVEMGNLPVSIIEQGGEGDSYPLSIRLTNCDFSTKMPEGSYFLFTFGGSADEADFALKGEASGIALRIEDNHAKKASPGVPMIAGRIDAKTMLLSYRLRIVSNHRELQAGSYYATIPFKIDYY